MLLRMKSRRKPLAVYTCLFGMSGELHDQPIAKDSRADFLCFTDREDLESNTWKLRGVRTMGLGASRESRRPKILPHLFLEDYEHSIYIDSTVRLTITPEEILSRWLPKTAPSLVCLRHPDRTCTYEEAEAVIKCGMDDEARIREQMDFYRSEGLPGNAGLVAATFLLRRHHCPVLRAFSEDWFAHVLRYSKRDQLSFCFNARRHRLPYLPVDMDLRANPIFEWPAWPHRVPYDFDPDTYLWLNPDVARSGMDATSHFLRFGRDEGRVTRYHPRLELDILANKHKTDKGSLYFNRHQYARIYELHLQGIRTSSFALLEIGLLRHDIQARTPGNTFADAPSLKMWKDYFPHAEIHGFDIQDFSAVEEDRITFTRGDASSPEDLLAAVRKCPSPLKVIIDDGSHASHHQQIALATLFPLLESGGLYFIEDLQYQPPSLERPGAVKTFQFLKALERGEAAHTNALGSRDTERLRQSIASIRFYDSMDFHALATGVPALAAIRKRE